MASIGLFEIFLARLCFPILFFLSNGDRIPINRPLIGMLPDLLPQVHRIHNSIPYVLERSNCTFYFKGLWFCGMDMLVTADPANIHYVMSSNFSYFPKGPEFKKRFDILGDGIVNADDDLWKNQRKVAQTLMNHQLFYQFSVKTSQDKVERGLVPVLEHVSKHGLVVDLQDLFQTFTFDANATCMLVTGYDPGCLCIDLPGFAFSKAMDDATEAIFYRHLLPDSIWKLQRWLGEEKKLKKAWETLHHIIAEMISTKKEELSEGNKVMEEHGRQGTDWLTPYMSTEDDRMGSKSDDSFLRDTIINFMLAGRDTISAGLSWFFWLVSKSPQVENKIREELKATVPENEAERWRLFDIEEVKKLVYLHGALCESLRLYPLVPFEFKSPLRKDDILLSGQHVYSMTKIFISSYSMGRMSSVWGNDCLEFKPERWITPRGGIKHEPSYKFFSFNAGPRTCLGKNVAFIQMKAVVAAMIHNYHVQVIDCHSVTPKPSVFLQMKHGMKVNLTKRWSD